VVNKASLVDILGLYSETNVQGEKQQKFDMLPNKKFITALHNRKVVCGVVSEKEDNYIALNSFDEKN